MLKGVPLMTTFDLKAQDLGYREIAERLGFRAHATRSPHIEPSILTRDQPSLV